MADIPGWTWVLIGGIITLASARLGKQFTLFFFLGLLFAAYGLYKVIAVYINRQRESVHEHHAAYHQAHSAPTQRQHAIHYLHCPRCKNLVRSVDFFCWRCGNRLR